MSLSGIAWVLLVAGLVWPALLGLGLGVSLAVLTLERKVESA